MQKSLGLAILVFGLLILTTGYSAVSGFDYTWNVAGSGTGSWTEFQASPNAETIYLCTHNQYNTPLVKGETLLVRARIKGAKVTEPGHVSAFIDPYANTSSEIGWDRGFWYQRLEDTNRYSTTWDWAFEQPLENTSVTTTSSYTGSAVLTPLVVKIPSGLPSIYKVGVIRFSYSFYYSSQHLIVTIYHKDGSMVSHQYTGGGTQILKFDPQTTEKIVFDNNMNPSDDYQMHLTIYKFQNSTGGYDPYIIAKAMYWNPQYVGSPIYSESTPEYTYFQIPIEQTYSGDWDICLAIMGDVYVNMLADSTKNSLEYYNGAWTTIDGQTLDLQWTILNQTASWRLVGQADVTPNTLGVHGGNFQVTIPLNSNVKTGDTIMVSIPHVISGYYYYGTIYSRIQVSFDGGTTWQNLVQKGNTPPWKSITVSPSGYENLAMFPIKVTHDTSSIIVKGYQGYDSYLHILSPIRVFAPGGSPMEVGELSDVYAEDGKLIAKVTSLLGSGIEGDGVKCSITYEDGTKQTDYLQDDGGGEYSVSLLHPNEGFSATCTSEKTSTTKTYSTQKLSKIIPMSKYYSQATAWKFCVNVEDTSGKQLNSGTTTVKAQFVSGNTTLVSKILPYSSTDGAWCDYINPISVNETNVTISVLGIGYALNSLTYSLLPSDATLNVKLYDADTGNELSGYIEIGNQTISVPRSIQLLWHSGNYSYIAYATGYENKTGTVSIAPKGSATITEYLSKITPNVTTKTNVKLMNTTLHLTAGLGSSTCGVVQLSKPTCKVYYKSGSSWVYWNSIQLDYNPDDIHTNIEQRAFSVDSDNRILSDLYAINGKPIPQFYDVKDMFYHGWGRAFQPNKILGAVRDEQLDYARLEDVQGNGIADLVLYTGNAFDGHGWYKSKLLNRTQPEIPTNPLGQIDYSAPFDLTAHLVGKLLSTGDVDISYYAETWGWLDKITHGEYPTNEHAYTIYLFLPVKHNGQESWEVWKVYNGTVYHSQGYTSIWDAVDSEGYCKVGGFETISSVDLENNTTWTGTYDLGYPTAFGIKADLVNATGNIYVYSCSDNTYSNCQQVRLITLISNETSTPLYTISQDHRYWKVVTDVSSGYIKTLYVSRQNKGDWLKDPNLGSQICQWLQTSEAHSLFENPIAINGNSIRVRGYIVIDLPTRDKIWYYTSVLNGLPYDIPKYNEYNSYQLGYAMGDSMPGWASSVVEPMVKPKVIGLPNEIPADRIYECQGTACATMPMWANYLLRLHLGFRFKPTIFATTYTFPPSTGDITVPATYLKLECEAGNYSKTVYVNATKTNTMTIWMGAGDKAKLLVRVSQSDGTPAVGYAVYVQNEGSKVLNAEGEAVFDVPVGTTAVVTVRSPSGNENAWSVPIKDYWNSEGQFGSKCSGEYTLDVVFNPHVFPIRVMALYNGKEVPYLKVVGKYGNQTYSGEGQPPFSMNVPKANMTFTFISPDCNQTVTKSFDTSYQNYIAVAFPNGTCNITEQTTTGNQGNQNSILGNNTGGIFSGNIFDMISNPKFIAIIMLFSLTITGLVVGGGWAGVGMLGGGSVLLGLMGLIPWSWVLPVLIIVSLMGASKIRGLVGGEI